MKLLNIVVIENCAKCDMFRDFSAYFCGLVGWHGRHWTSDELAQEEGPVRDHVAEFFLDEEGVFEGPVFVLQDGEGNILESLKPKDTGEFYRTFYPLTKEDG